MIRCPILTLRRALIGLIAFGAVLAIARWWLVLEPRMQISINTQISSDYDQGLYIYLDDSNLGTPVAEFGRLQLMQHGLDGSWVKRRVYPFGVYLADCADSNGTVPLITVRSKDCSGDLLEDLRANRLHRINSCPVGPTGMSLGTLGPVLPIEEQRRVSVRVNDNGSHLEVTIDTVPQAVAVETKGVQLHVQLVRLKDGLRMGKSVLLAPNLEALIGMQTTLNDLTDDEGIIIVSVWDQDGTQLPGCAYPLGCFPRCDAKR